MITLSLNEPTIRLLVVSQTYGLSVHSGLVSIACCEHPPLQIGNILHSKQGGFLNFEVSRSLYLLFQIIPFEVRIPSLLSGVKSLAEHLNTSPL